MKGEDIRTVDIGENPVFILGDHLGLPPKELKRLKKLCTPITIGPKIYFASHTVAIVNNEIDRREKSWLYRIINIKKGSSPLRHHRCFKKDGKRSIN